MKVVRRASPPTKVSPEGHRSWIGHSDHLMMVAAEIGGGPAVKPNTPHSHPPRADRLPRGGRADRLGRRRAGTRSRRATSGSSRAGSRTRCSCCRRPRSSSSASRPSARISSSREGARRHRVALGEQPRLRRGGRPTGAVPRSRLGHLPDPSHQRAVRQHQHLPRAPREHPGRTAVRIRPTARPRRHVHVLDRRRRRPAGPADHRRAGGPCPRGHARRSVAVLQRRRRDLAHVRRDLRARAVLRPARGHRPRRRHPYRLGRWHAVPDELPPHGRNRGPFGVAVVDIATRSARVVYEHRDARNPHEQYSRTPRGR